MAGCDYINRLYGTQGHWEEPIEMGEFLLLGSKGGIVPWIKDKEDPRTGKELPLEETVLSQEGEVPNTWLRTHNGPLGQITVLTEHVEITHPDKDSKRALLAFHLIITKEPSGERKLSAGWGGYGYFNDNDPNPRTRELHGEAIIGTPASIGDAFKKWLGHSLVTLQTLNDRDQTQFSGAAWLKAITETIDTEIAEQPKKRADAYQLKADLIKRHPEFEETDALQERLERIQTILEEAPKTDPEIPALQAEEKEIEKKLQELYRKRSPKKKPESTGPTLE